tara:strand:- start:2074 stop:3528 length:1455 start_codon:yes stop_codon:yes gene_type:complete
MSTQKPNEHIEITNEITNFLTHVKKATCVSRGLHAIYVNQDHGAVLTDGHVLMSYPINAYTGAGCVIEVFGKLNKGETITVDVSAPVSKSAHVTVWNSRGIDTGKVLKVIAYPREADQYTKFPTDAIDGMLKPLDRSIYAHSIAVDPDILKLVALHGGKASLAIGMKESSSAIDLAWANGVRGILMPLRVEKVLDDETDVNFGHILSNAHKPKSKPTNVEHSNEMSKLKEEIKVLSVDLRITELEREDMQIMHSAAMDYVSIAAGISERDQNQQRVICERARMQWEAKVLNFVEGNSYGACAASQMRNSLASMYESILAPSILAACTDESCDVVEVPRAEYEELTATFNTVTKAREDSDVYHKAGTDALETMAKAARDGLSGCDYADESMNLLAGLGYVIDVEDDVEDDVALRVQAWRADEMTMTEEELHMTDDEADDLDWGRVDVSEPEPVNVDVDVDVSEPEPVSAPVLLDLGEVIRFVLND